MISHALGDRSSTGPNPMGRRLGAFVLVFAMLLVVHRECIDSPITHDQAKGLWNEATFLANNRFDYYRLRFFEQTQAQGGGSYYITSILPTLIALTMIATPSPIYPIVIYHLFCIACAAAIAVVIFEMIRPIGGALGAAMACAALLTTPLFSLQIELAGMEIPTLLFVVFSALAIHRGRPALAAAHANLAFLMKPTGAMMTAVGMTYYLLAIPLILWRRREPRDEPLRPYLVGLILFAVSFFVQLLVFAYGGMDHGEFRPVYESHH